MSYNAKVYFKQGGDTLVVADGGTLTTEAGSTATYDGQISVAAAVTSSGDTEGIGYATGAGAAVTQLTSAVTAVTINAASGAITTVAQNIAAAGEVQFTVNNSMVAATDVILLSIKSGSTGGTTIARVTAVADDSFQITLANLHASVAETGTLVINFAVIKGVAA